MMELQKLIDGLRAHKNGAASYESVDEAIKALEAMRDVDAEKVCKGLECFVNHVNTYRDDCRKAECEYLKAGDCEMMVMSDALALIRQQQARIAELEAGQKWISVKDRLPENIRPVLVWEKQGFAYVDNYHNNAWSIGSANEAIITHWMPLPEPQKEEEHADGA